MLHKMKKLKNNTIYFISSCCLLISSNCLAVSAEQILLIKQAAEQQVEAIIAPPLNGVQKISAQQIDSRLNLPDCSEPLTTSIPGKQNYKFSATVLVQCNVEKWKLYVPVRITTLIPMVVATRTMANGTKLSKSDLKIGLVNSRFQRGQIFTDVKQLIGSKVKRNLSIGNPVQGNNICLVCKKDPVIIIASSANLTVKAKGIALSDGSLGDEVTVKNIKSKRTIIGTVSSVGIVKVSF